MKHSEGFLAIVNDAKSRVKEMTVDELKALAPGSYQLIDVREDSEWAAGHAVGAVHIGKGVIERDIETKVPDKGETLVLYCGGGFRSALAADVLQKMGYQNPISLAGGWRAWNEAAMPVERSEGAARHFVGYPDGGCGAGHRRVALFARAKRHVVSLLVRMRAV